MIMNEPIFTDDTITDRGGTNYPYPFTTENSRGSIVLDTPTSNSADQKPQQNLSVQLPTKVDDIHHRRETLQSPLRHNNRQQQRWSRQSHKQSIATNRSAALGDLFDDTDTSLAGRLRSRFWGLEEAKWWLTYQCLGNVNGEYNMLHRPLKCIPRRSSFRILVIRVVDSMIFEWSMIVMIAFNAAMLGVDVPETKSSLETQQLITVCDTLFLVIFTVEILLKA
eukprot:PhF_6_TR1990/c0_g1_i4/m.3341